MLSSFLTLLFYNFIKYKEIKVPTRSITVGTYTNFLSQKFSLYGILSIQPLYRSLEIQLEKTHR